MNALSGCHSKIFKVSALSAVLVVGLALTNFAHASATYVTTVCYKLSPASAKIVAAPATSKVFPNNKSFDLKVTGFPFYSAQDQATCYTMIADINVTAWYNDSGWNANNIGKISTVSATINSPTVDYLGPKTCSKANVMINYSLQGVNSNGYRTFTGKAILNVNAPNASSLFCSL